MTSDVKDRITEDVKDAMRAREKERLGVLRQVTAAIKQREVDERIELDDTQVLAVLDKMIKQRREAEAQYRSADRPELAEQETFEIGVIEAYMPARLGDEEIAALVEAAIAEAGAATMRDMGKVMGALKPRLQGRADLGAVSALVKERLAG